MADARADGRPVEVRLLFWDDYVGARPQVIVSRDAADATIRAGWAV